MAEDNDGKLKNRVVLFCDELGTMPPFDILPLFSAGRSRRLTLVPIIQSLAQLEKNYGKEGSEIIRDNCQDTIFGGFAPGSQTAEVLSKALGSRTVQVGSVSQSKHDPSRSLQMVERPLMTADELRSIPKGSFIVMKTGCHPMQTRLRLFLDWGITLKKGAMPYRHMPTGRFSMPGARIWRRASSVIECGLWVQPGQPAGKDTAAMNAPAPKRLQI